MVIAQPVLKKILIFRRRPTFAKKCQQRVMTMRGAASRNGRIEGRGLSSRGRILAGAGLRLAWLSGVARLMERRRGGAGAILRFEHVRPARPEAFQPRRAHEITPQFLERVINALKRWKFDVVSMDEVIRRAAGPALPRRFVCLTFDGATRDLMTYGIPVLAKHRVPFTVYVPTAFPDGLGQAWESALEAVIARNDRVALMMEGRQHRFEMPEPHQKAELYELLERWLRALRPQELSAAINDLCKRHSVDLAALSREAFMDWDDLAKLAVGPNVTFGSMTVNAPMLANLNDADAYREISMGRAVAQAAFDREIRHFAYPFGDRASFNRRHVALSKDAGFASAVTTLPGTVKAEGRSDPHALPRIAWDGRSQSLAVMRALLSGMVVGKGQD
jgi:peptidoglycan/xylan/chitin deacetylase (PgdA/CDA1 family)